MIGESLVISYADATMVSRLGRYSVLKHLASGGMADVLLGRADGIEGFERHVVLKRIRPEHARDQRFIRMFLDEARVAANLHHQHIVQVHDIGESGGEYFIAMEYIHGEDVRTILSNASKTRAHVPLSHAIAIVSAAAGGLHYAHERRGADKRPLGIVHRDISPSNILVGYDGSIKVVDFGIAKAAMRQETRSGNLKGKISYMSPEQCKGAEVDRRSDVYSLGVVLYELATTTRLFKGENDYLVMDQIVNGRVSLPRVRRPDLPNELSAIIMRAIAPDPERRYFTADELRVALDQFANKAALTTASSAIGGYLRKQFGEKPEPWLELESHGAYSFDDFPAPSGSAPSNSWTELPRSDDHFRRSTSSIPRQSGPIAVLAGSAAPDVAVFEGTRQRTSASRIPSTPPPTDSKMGWESQQPARAPRTFTTSKVAMIAAPLVAILGVAIWRLAVTSTPPPPAVVSAPATQPPPPAPPPVVTPIPETPPVTQEVAMETVPAKAAARAEPGASKARTAASSSPVTKKAASGKGAESSPAPTAVLSAKPEPAAPPPSAPAAAPAAPAPAGAPPPQQVAAAVAPPTTATPAAALAMPLPAPAPPAPPQNVAPTALDANRIAGEKDIIPDDLTQAEIGRSGVSTLIGSYKVCITTDGTINAVTPLKPTGFSAYDAKILNTIRTKWRYRPFMVNGKATAVCTAVRFIYSQK
ncbi:MAG TPA: protein kinase [Kofleriaceae bacterium]|nr:protein kinase [Kofleriaceae bacterium]